MKTISIRKNKDFSQKSNVFIHIGTNRIHIKGFGPFTFNIEPGQEIYASQQWVRSNLIHYDDISDNSFYLIKPRLSKSLALISLIVFMACTAIFLITKFRWSFIPLLPIAFYVFTYLSILKDRYLILKREEKETI